MVSRVNSLGLLGMDAFPVEVETSLSNGMPAFDMVGSPFRGIIQAIFSNAE